MSNKWKNRIVGYGEEVPDQLLANPKNYRIHPKYQQDALSGVLSEVGIVDTVLVNKQTGFVLDGHLRVAMAISSGQPTIPVTYVDLSPDEEALILATFDPISALAIPDDEMLSQLIDEINTDNDAIKELLASLSVNNAVAPDSDTEWKGMPEFEQDDSMGAFTLIVHFMTHDDVDTFAKLVGQKLTDKTKFIWFPAQEAIDGKKYIAHGKS